MMIDPSVVGKIERAAQTVYDVVANERGQCYEAAMSLGMVLDKMGITTTLMKGNIKIVGVFCSHHYWLEYRPLNLVIDAATAQFGQKAPWVESIEASPQYVERQERNAIGFEFVLDYYERALAACRFSDARERHAYTQ